jgi:uncharacterized protein YbjT (DUF2867 family)
MAHTDLIALTGATGYVGGRLLGTIERDGRRVRCLARRPEYLRARLGSTTEVVTADCLEPDTLVPALAGATTAYYLVHSMGSARDYARADVAAARNFGLAARRAGVRQIVYLGGLGDPASSLSTHLRSRQDTGHALRAGGVPVVEFRASVILGSGSLSFELIRALVERLPVMTCPRWVWTPAQPIGIEDVIAYLHAALRLPLGTERTYEIGGAECVSYAGIMQEYARQRGLRRLLLSVPVLTPRLSSLWLGLTTPVYARIGRQLIEGMRNPTVVRDDAALREFAIRPMGLHDAIARALANEDHEFAVTRWSDALSSAGRQPAYGGVRRGSRLIDARELDVAAPPEAAFAPIRRIGGTTGWYYAAWLWSLRGMVDLLAGGVGLRRGRRDQNDLRVGDALDFWRVETYEPNRRLRLAAEMRLPGRAWLEFEVRPRGSGSRVHQTAVFEPAGLSGLLYWYLIYPVHALIFAGMLRRIGLQSEQAVNRVSDRHAVTAAPPAP